MSSINKITKYIMENEIKPIWSVVANVVPKRLYGEDGSEIKIGTKHFTPNSKVYVIDGFWGMGGESVTVIDSPRKTTKYVVITIQSSTLYNYRAKLIYKPQILKLLKQDFYNIANDEMTEEHAKSIAISLSHRRWEDAYYRRLKTHMKKKYSNEFIQKCKQNILCRFCGIYVNLREESLSEMDAATKAIRFVLNEQGVDSATIVDLIEEVHSLLGFNESELDSRDSV